MSSRVLSVTNQDLADFRTFMRVWFVCNVQLDYGEFKGQGPFINGFAQTFEYFEYMNEPFMAAETILDLSKSTDGSLRVSAEHYEAYMAIHDFCFTDFLPEEKVGLIARIQKRFKEVLESAIVKEDDVATQEQDMSQGKQYLN